MNGVDDQFQLRRRHPLGIPQRSTIIKKCASPLMRSYMLHMEHATLFALTFYKLGVHIPPPPRLSEYPTWHLDAVTPPEF
jgi:hypothetical protein